MKLNSVVIESGNAEELSKFYQKLLGGDIKTYIHDNKNWIVLKNINESTTCLVFQQIDNYVNSKWTKEHPQQEVIHLDFYSDNVDEDVKFALECGAKILNKNTGDWIELVDPSGHPFCIVPNRKKEN